MIHSFGLGQDEQKEGESNGKIIPAADSSRTRTTTAVVHNGDDDHDHDGDGHGDGHGHANDREDGSSREKKALDSKLRRLQQAIATFEKQKNSRLGKAQT